MTDADDVGERICLVHGTEGVWSKNSNEGYHHGRCGLACGVCPSFGLKQRSREAVQRLGFAISGGRPAIQARTGPETPGAFLRRMNGAKRRVGSNSAGWGKSLASGLAEDLSMGRTGRRARSRKPRPPG